MVKNSIAISLLLILSGAAWADENPPIINDSKGVTQSYQADTIKEGNLTLAERELRSLIAENPHDPYALLNLAYIYQQSGRNYQARVLYERVLDLRSNPLAELPSGKPARVKRIAQRGIDELACLKSPRARCK